MHGNHLLLEYTLMQLANSAARLGLPRKCNSATSILHVAGSVLHLVKALHPGA